MKTSAKPVYQVTSHNTQIVKGKAPNAETIGAYIQEGKAILWLHSSMHTATIQDGKFNWHSPKPDPELKWEKHLVELRAFNPDREWRLWRDRNGLQNRQVEDQRQAVPQGKTRAIDASMKVRGIVGQAFQDEGKPTLFLKTRNYLGLNAFGMSIYEGCRFLDIAKKED